MAIAKHLKEMNILAIYECHKNKSEKTKIGLVNKKIFQVPGLANMHREIIQIMMKIVRRHKKNQMAIKARHDKTSSKRRHMYVNRLRTCCRG